MLPDPAGGTRPEARRGAPRGPGLARRPGGRADPLGARGRAAVLDELLSAPRRRRRDAGPQRRGRRPRRRRRDHPPSRRGAAAPERGALPLADRGQRGDRLDRQPGGQPAPPSGLPGAASPARTRPPMRGSASWTRSIPRIASTPGPHGRRALTQPATLRHRAPAPGRPPATYRHMSVRAVPILEPDGTLREWVGTHTDITERKEAEAAIEAARAGRRGRQCGQEPVPRQHEPRVAHPALRGHRLLRDGAGGAGGSSVRPTSSPT